MVTTFSKFLDYKLQEVLKRIFKFQPVSIMQSLQQKQLEALIESSLNNNSQTLSIDIDEIIRLLSCRVDMPKHLISLISKKLAVKQQQKISFIFDILWFVTEKYDNKIALFNQISGKEFLLKIQSILSLKDLNEDLKSKIIDIVYKWKDMYKENKELFPNFWNFYNTFEKKGYTPSNLTFQTRYQQLHPQDSHHVQQRNNQTKQGQKNIFDLIEGENEGPEFDRIQKHALILFYNLLKKIILQNKIISNTSPDIMDVPPVLKENMADLKIMEDAINKFIGQHKNQLIIDTTMDFIRAIHLTEKRYTELITKYLPQKFELSNRLKKFDEFCKMNEITLNLNQPLNNQLDLLNLPHAENKLANDLLDMGISNNQTQMKNEQRSIKSFFGNLLDKAHAPQQETMSNQPIQNDFRTDMDFKAYQAPKTIKQRYNQVKNLTAQDLFKF